ncbi:hypothetical protein BP6252_11502 [Coleophoma cylindrospora]|uniref:Clr5 domain-containing protein n=1 Tax=Coleophoma cylindrospora TaxID=1849047 RepID=A0A3D8QJW5_9HELO|nr:hypothetical protein BP6252_11502 [Coleophoma cylindrospora]
MANVELPFRVLPSIASLSSASSIIQSTPAISIQTEPECPDVGLSTSTPDDIPLPSNPPTSRDWEAYRSTFTQLYSAEEMTLREVKKHMEERFEFYASERMFKARISKWNLNKNYKAFERQKIAQVAISHKKNGCPSPKIFFHGRPVKMDRIWRHCGKLHSPESSESEQGSRLAFQDTELKETRCTCFFGHHDQRCDQYSGEIQPSKIDERRIFKACILHTQYPLLTTTESKFSEIILTQVNQYYTSYSKARLTGSSFDFDELSVNTEDLQTPTNPGEYRNKISSAIEMINSNQARVGWRLLHEASESTRTMLKARNPYTLRCLMSLAGQLTVFTGGYDLFGPVWSYISEMASTVLGTNHPVAVSCRAVAFVKARRLLEEVVMRSTYDILEQNLGSNNFEVLESKFAYASVVSQIGHIGEVERLQRLVLQDVMRLRDDFCIVDTLVRLGITLQQKGDYCGAKKFLRDAVSHGKETSGSRYPNQADLGAVMILARMSEPDEYSEIESLLQESLESCLKKDNWGPNDWHTLDLLGVLNAFLERGGRFEEARNLRSRYVHAF